MCKLTNRQAYHLLRERQRAGVEIGPSAQAWMKSYVQARSQRITTWVCAIACILILALAIPTLFVVATHEDPARQNLPTD